MASVSLSLPHGKEGLSQSDFSVGTLAPNAGDVEVRINTTDTNGNPVSRLDAIKALQATIRALESGALYTNRPA